VNLPADLRASRRTGSRESATSCATTSSAASPRAAAISPRPRHGRAHRALHYVFDTPRDRLVWDVGHQAYPHKVLTGARSPRHHQAERRARAVPVARESEYDTFGVGHSSTRSARRSAWRWPPSCADDAQGGRHHRRRRHDGGMAWEALLNAGRRKTNLLVVLNDNDMSISENVGALSNYFAKVLSGRTYSTLRSGGKKILKQMPTMWELARRSEEMMKGMVLPGTIFEELGFNYIGPMNGHDIKELVTTLRNMRNLKGPQLLHVVTKKGKGYDPGREGSDQMARAGSVRSGQRHDLQGKGHLAPPIRRCSASG
jgi:1-deoxy-D-xylulose-5-phosphate synthase